MANGRTCLPSVSRLIFAPEWIFRPAAQRTITDEISPKLCAKKSGANHWSGRLRRWPCEVEDIDADLSEKKRVRINHCAWTPESTHPSWTPPGIIDSANHQSLSTGRKHIPSNRSAELNSKLNHADDFCSRPWSSWLAAQQGLLNNEIIVKRPQWIIERF